MKRYVEPRLFLDVLKSADVITASGEPDYEVRPDDSNDGGIKWGELRPGIPLDSE